MSKRYQVVLVSVAAIAAILGMAVFILGGTGDGNGDSGGGDDVGKLTPFTAADARFRAAFPGKPTRTEQDVPAGSTSLHLIQYTSEVKGRRGFSVGWFQLVTAPEPDGVRSFLEATQRGSVAAVKGTLVSSTFVKHDGHEAVEYLARLGTGGYVKSRTVLIGRDVYVIQVVGPESEPVKYDEFVNSLEALPA